LAYTEVDGYFFDVATNEHLANLYSQGEIGKDVPIRSFQIVQKKVPWKRHGMLRSIISTPSSLCGSMKDVKLYKVEIMQPSI
jgi:hypothetical protein